MKKERFVFSFSDGVGAVEISLRHEGIYTPENVLIGYEFLSDIKSTAESISLNPEAFFINLPCEQFIEFFCWQLSCADIIFLTFSESQRELFISINIPPHCITAISMNETVIKKMNELHGNLKLEIHEASSLSDNKSELEKLSLVCPLWLDDFGKGDSRQQLLHSHVFKGVKIDKNLLQTLAFLPDGVDMIKNLVSSLKCIYEEVVIEGVENEKLLKIVKNSGVTALQGWYWKKPER